MRSLLPLLGLLCLGGCAFIFGGNPRARAEADIRKMHSDLADWREAYNAHDLESAHRYLDRIESRVAHADPYLQGHPELEDVVAEVERARQIEKLSKQRDEEQKRGDAMRAWGEEVNGVIGKGNGIAAALRTRAPKDEDVVGLEGVLRDLARLHDSGTAFSSDARFAELDKTLLAAGKSLLNERDAARWAMSASNELQAKIDTALLKEKDLGGRPKAIRKAARGVVRSFGACVRVAESLRKRDGFNADVHVATALGEMTLDETVLNCKFRAAGAVNMAKNGRPGARRGSLRS